MSEGATSDFGSSTSASDDSDRSDFESEEDESSDEGSDADGDLSQLPHNYQVRFILSSTWAFQTGRAHDSVTIGSKQHNLRSLYKFKAEGLIRSEKLGVSAPTYVVKIDKAVEKATDVEGIVAGIFEDVVERARKDQKCSNTDMVCCLS